MAGRKTVRGRAESHAVAPTLGLLAALAIVAAVIAVAVRAGAGPPAWLGAVLLLATFLAGHIAEANYLFAAAAAVLLHLSHRPANWSHRPANWSHRSANWPAYLPGLALLALPITADQTTLVAAELALLAALLLTGPQAAARPATGRRRRLGFTRGAG